MEEGKVGKSRDILWGLRGWELTKERGEVCLRNI